VENFVTTQFIVSPEKIESELLKIWEGLAKENKMRASLFNLVIFSKLSPRTDYIRKIVQKVVEKFPCRTIFISEDPDTKQSYLKTAISVLAPNILENSVACDLIDIGVAGEDLPKVPSLVLPHLLPDLPVYLLWAEDPSLPHPLFTPLAKLSTRVIFDSESTEHLRNFANRVLELHEKTKIDIADLNWARTQGWRDLISSVFSHPEEMKNLYNISLLKITYNAKESASFCHLKIQSMYLLGWLCSRLGWKVSQTEKDLSFQFQSHEQLHPGEAVIESTIWEKLGPGTVISIEMKTAEGRHILASRIAERYHYVTIQLSTPNSCELPYEFGLGQTATGQSLVKEICTKGTSLHYLEMLKTIANLNKDPLC